MTRHFSTAHIVSSIFKKYVDQQITPEFIRNESDCLCDALGIPRKGDPGRTVRKFESKKAVQKDANKANFYWYDQNKCQDKKFKSYQNLYNHPSFDLNVYKVVRFMNELKKRMVADPEFADRIINQHGFNL